MRATGLASAGGSMSMCPSCNFELPLGARACPQCGVAVGAVEGIMDTQIGTGGRTLIGSPHAPTPVDISRTMPEGGLNYDALRARFGDGPLDGRTLQDDAGAANLRQTNLQQSWPGKPSLLGPEKNPPSLVPLEAIGSTVPADQGQAARVRAESIDMHASELALAPTPGIRPAKATPRPSLLRNGDVVEGYRVLEEIGRGGMGRVYRAEHEVTGQVVAFKMLLPQLFKDERLRARFVNEAQVLAKMKHPNLVPLLSFIERDGRAIIVMPLVEGITLEKMLNRQGRLSFSVARDLFCQICEGLAHVHGLAVMHRDLKPANVIVERDGTARVTDFGIARSAGSQKLTMQGMVVGTAEYLSPEQANGTATDDPRSDIYALGILLYEMLTGRVPFRHPSAGQVLIKQVQSRPPPPRSVNPEIPEGVERAVLQALEKRPEDRFETVVDFRDAVINGFDGRVMSPAPQPEVVDVTSTVPRPRSVAAGGGVGKLVAQILLGAGLGAGLAAIVWHFING